MICSTTSADICHLSGSLPSRLSPAPTPILSNERQAETPAGDVYYGPVLIGPIDLGFFFKFD